MRRLALMLILVVATTIFLGILSSAIVQGTDRERLIQAASQEIEDLAMPYTYNHTVDYNYKQRSVVVGFDTGVGFKWNLNLFYLLWWDTQFIALNAFEKWGLKVETVGVFTNFEDGSGPFLMVTDTAYIRKYANAVHGMGRWLDLTDSFVWDEAIEDWRSVPK